MPRNPCPSHRPPNRLNCTGWQDIKHQVTTPPPLCGYLDPWSARAALPEGWMKGSRALRLLASPSTWAMARRPITQSRRPEVKVMEYKLCRMPSGSGSSIFAASPTEQNMEWTWTLETWMGEVFSPVSPPPPPPLYSTCTVNRLSVVSCSAVPCGAVLCTVMQYRKEQYNVM